MVSLGAVLACVGVWKERGHEQCRLMHDVTERLCWVVCCAGLCWAWLHSDEGEMVVCGSLLCG